MMKYKYWIFLLAVLLLAACSGDGDSGQPGSVPDIPGTPDNPSKPSVTGSPLHLSGLTRSELTADDVHSAGDATKGSKNELSPIQIFLTTGTGQSEGEFIYDDTEATPVWRSTIGVKETNNFIYGFAPATAALSTISTLTSEANDYSAGARLSLQNLKATGADDICVIVGVQHGTSPVTAPDWTPRLGAFGFTKGANNYVSLLLDHLFARIDFNFKIGQKYSELRSIRIKQVELVSTVRVTGLTVTLHATADGTHPILNESDDIKYTTETVQDGIRGVLYDYSTDTANPTGKELSLSGTEIPGFFAPLTSVAQNLTLVCIYDVYNLKGTRVRENCTATNKLAAISGAERGKKWTVNLTVEPTYLYQLSDDELNNPTIVVDSE